jgi:hypothetical protein
MSSSDEQLQLLAFAIYPLSVTELYTEIHNIYYIPMYFTFRSKCFGRDPLPKEKENFNINTVSP